MYKSTEEKKETWISNSRSSMNAFKYQNFNKDLSNDDLQVLQKLMHYCYKQISSSQIRNAYNLIIDRSTQSASKRIKLAYIAGRTDKKKNEAMLIFLEKVESMLKNEFIGVESFVEACLAYHKYYENMGITYKQ